MKGLASGFRLLVVREEGGAISMSISRGRLRTYAAVGTALKDIKGRRRGRDFGLNGTEVTEDLTVVSMDDIVTVGAAVGSIG